MTRSEVREYVGAIGDREVEERVEEQLTGENFGEKQLLVGAARTTFHPGATPLTTTGTQTRTR